MVVNMVLVSNPEYVIVILDGLVQIVTFVPNSPVVPKMGIVPNPWNAYAKTVMKAISVTNQFVARVVMKPLDFVINPVNVGAD